MRILLVEHDDRIADALLQALTRRGLSVDRVVDGGDVLDRLQDVGVVLLDLDFLDDGVALCRAIRAASDAAIIVVSVHGEVGDRILGLRAGADDYLVKPYDVGELLARVDAVRRRREQEPAGGAVRVGDVDIDVARHEVAVAGESVVLSDEEFEVLALLADAAGAPVSEQRIIAAVWGGGWAGTNRTLDVHVTSLRAKLGRPALVETVPDVGYRLATDGTTAVAAGHPMRPVRRPPRPSDSTRHDWPSDYPHASPAEAVNALVDALLRVPSLADDDGRETVMDHLPIEFGLSVPRGTSARQDVLALVRVAIQRDGGLAALLTAVALVEGASLNADELRRAVVSVQASLLGDDILDILPVSTSRPGIGRRDSRRLTDDQQAAFAGPDAPDSVSSMVGVVGTDLDDPAGDRPRSHDRRSTMAQGRSEGRAARLWGGFVRGLAQSFGGSRMTRARRRDSPWQRINERLDGTYTRLGPPVLPVRRGESTSSSGCAQ